MNTNSFEHSVKPLRTCRSKELVRFRVKAIRKYIEAVAKVTPPSDKIDVGRILDEYRYGVDKIVLTTLMPTLRLWDGIKDCLTAQL